MQMQRCCCAVVESRATVALSVFTEISKEAVACVFEVTVALATVYGTMCVALSGEYNALKAGLEVGVGAYICAVSNYTMSC